VSGDLRALDEALRDLGTRLSYPPQPNLVPAVRAAISIERRPARRPAPWLRRAIVLVPASLLLAVGGLAAASPAFREALGEVLSVPGIRIVQRATSPLPPPPGRDLELGERTGVEEAGSEAGIDVAVPASLGEPDAVYLDRVGVAEIVWLAYRPRPGLPAAPETGVGALLGQFRALPHEELLLKKLPDQGATVVDVDVDGAEGHWIEDGPHQLQFLDEDGVPIPDRTRLAGNTLVWSRHGVTYRLESALALSRALEIAESVG
jgi:hypothetical protein